jgi:undecaprenyl-diphosphatase
MALQVVLATLPVVGAGYVLKTYFGGVPRSAEVVAWATLGFGIVLWIADQSGMTIRRIEHMRYGEALVIGVAQVLALIPGTSRSGITMTAARMLGYERAEAARFSMLLSIPTILAAGLLIALDLYEAGDVRLTRDALIAGGLAFLTALVAIVAMMGWLKRASFTPFVLYRIALGGGLLVWLYTG